MTSCGELRALAQRLATTFVVFALVASLWLGADQTPAAARAAGSSR